MPRTPTIGLLGDVMLGRAVAERLRETPSAELWSREAGELCATCDALILNLECCLSRGGSPTSLLADKPFFFRGPPHGVEALEAIGATLAGVANNHILDFGPQALVETLSSLHDAGIATAGAGPGAGAARAGAVLQAGALRLGVLALSDHPCEYAAEGRAPGIAYANLRAGLPAWVGTELRRLRSQADVVLAFPHWGPNMSSRPARWQRKRARELLVAGADAVAGHSAHVFHGVELTPSGPLLYDLGGALDDYMVDPTLRNDLGILALWRPGGEPEVELVGLHLDFCRTELARGKDAEWIARRLERSCGEFGSAVERLPNGHFALSRSIA